MFRTASILAGKITDHLGQYFDGNPVILFIDLMHYCFSVVSLDNFNLVIGAVTCLRQREPISSRLYPISFLEFSDQPLQFFLINKMFNPLVKVLKNNKAGLSYIC